VSSLTIEKLLRARDILAEAELKPTFAALPERPLFEEFFRPRSRFAGMDIYTRPPSPAKIQVRDIKLSDGTSILTAEFRAKMNAWLVQMFGYEEDPFKDQVLIFQNSLFVRPEQMAIIRNIAC